MATITVLPDDPRTSSSPYRAMTENRHAVGTTVGQALDALGSGSMPPETTLVVLQPMVPDVYFTREQMDRLSALMSKFRLARDAGQVLAEGERTELEELVRAEVTATARRASNLLSRLQP